jgi:hypothetical protein
LREEDDPIPLLGARCVASLSTIFLVVIAGAAQAELDASEFHIGF